MVDDFGRDLEMITLVQFYSGMKPLIFFIIISVLEILQFHSTRVSFLEVQFRERTLISKRKTLSLETSDTIRHSKDSINDKISLVRDLSRNKITEKCIRRTMIVK